MSEAVQWLLKAIPTYLLTFGRIFVAPKTEIIEKCKGGESAVPGALAFLAVSMLILYGFEGSKDSQSDFWTTVIRTVANSVIVGLATVGALALAWRMTGARIEFPKVLVAYCYTSGVSVLLWSIFGLAIDGILKAWYPETYPAYMRAAETTPMVLSRKFWQSQGTLQAMPDYQKFGLISTIGSLFPFLWLFAAWGTYRRLAAVGRLRSAIALAIFFLLLCLFGLILSYTPYGGSGKS